MEEEIRSFYLMLNEPRNSQLENEKRKWLCTLNERTRFEILKEAININSYLAIKFCRSCLNNQDYISELLEFGILTKDASEIGLWIKELIDKISFKSIKKILLKIKRENFASYEIFIYWLKSIYIDETKKKYLLKMINEIEMNFVEYNSSNENTDHDKSEKSGSE